MNQVRREVMECAQHFLYFFRENYPRAVRKSEWSLTKRLEILGGWVEDKSDYKHLKSDYGLYQERSRAGQLRELYEEGDLDRIANYGRTNVNTMTGGFFTVDFLCDKVTGFHNETTQNHLRFFDPEYVGNLYGDYASEANPLTPFYQQLMEQANSIESSADKIRYEIMGSEEFKHAIAGKAVEEMTYEELTAHYEEFSVTYLVEEFKRKGRVIPLLIQVEQLYSDIIELTETVLELSKQHIPSI